MQLPPQISVGVNMLPALPPLAPAGDRSMINQMPYIVLQDYTNMHTVNPTLRREGVVAEQGIPRIVILI
jgi:hypothetical protein